MTDNHEPHEEYIATAEDLDNAVADGYRFIVIELKRRAVEIIEEVYRNNKIDEDKP